MGEQLVSYLQECNLRLRTSQLPITHDSTRDRVAMIIEPRPHSLLEPVIRNVMHHLPSWNLVVVTSEEGETYLNSLLPNWEYLTCILPMNNLTTSQYNQLLLSPLLWEETGTEEHLLLFQTDSLILQTAGLEEFLSYAFVGAPFDIKGSGKYVKTPNGLVMNGGLSLRHRSAMKRIIKEITIPQIEQYRASKGKNKIKVNSYGEDVFFVHGAEMLGLPLPTMEIANRFAIEDLWTGDPVIGLHGWQYKFFDKQIDSLLKLATT